VLCDGRCSDLQRCRAQDEIAAFRRGHDRFELGGDGAFDHLAAQLRRDRRCRRRFGFRGRAQLGSDRRDRQSQACDPLAEIGRHAQTNVLAEGLQFHRQRNERLHIAT